MPISWRRGAWSCRAPRASCRRTSRSGARIWATEGGPRMDTLIQQIVSGLATGGIYGSLALALVMIYQATDVVNYAQGEMAMFSTYLAWSMLNRGAPYWVAFVLTVTIAFVGGLAIERLIIRPVEQAPVLAIVIVTLGLR